MTMEKKATHPPAGQEVKKDHYFIKDPPFKASRLVGH